MTSFVVELRAGAQVWFDGEAWTVQELASTATLFTGDRSRCVALSALVAQAVVLSGQDDEGPQPASVDQELVGVVLTALTPQQLAMLEERAKTCP